MGETKWNIQEIQRLKRKQLVQYNLVMFLLFMLVFYYMKIGMSVLLFTTILCLFFCLIIAHTLYTLITGKMLGTKTSRLIQAFDKDYLGKKRWKRKKIIEFIFLSILGIMCTVLLFRIDFVSSEFDIYSLMPFFGGWSGMNIGEIFRIRNL